MEASVEASVVVVLVLAFRFRALGSGKRGGSAEENRASLSKTQSTIGLCAATATIPLGLSSRASPYSRLEVARHSVSASARAREPPTWSPVTAIRGTWAREGKRFFRIQS